MHLLSMYKVRAKIHNNNEIFLLNYCYLTYFISECPIYASVPLSMRSDVYYCTLAKMPLLNTTQSVQQEGRIALALDALKQGHFTSFRGAAQSYDVQSKTLSRRFRGQLPRCDTRPSNCKLTEMEESTLVEWILSIDKRGLSPRSDTVRQMANLLLQKQSDPSQGTLLTVGKL
jgi:hypothetical protein